MTAAPPLSDIGQWFAWITGETGDVRCQVAFGLVVSIVVHLQMNGTLTNCAEELVGLVVTLIAKCRLMTATRSEIKSDLSAADPPPHGSVADTVRDAA